MREQQWILMDNLKRKLYIKFELKKLLSKSVLKNTQIPNVQRYNALYKKNKINRWATISEQTNRCYQSGRSWSVNKLTRQSRFVFRTESYAGHLPGFRRASW